MRRKCLTWAALAFATQVAGASAETTTLTFDGACNTVTITTSGTSVDAVLGGTGCEAGLGTGLNGKIHGDSLSGLGILFNGDPASYYLVLTRPYVTGGNWWLYKTTNGINGSWSSGLYSVSGTAEHHPQGSQSITAHMH